MAKRPNRFNHAAREKGGIMLYQAISGPSLRACVPRTSGWTGNSVALRNALIWPTDDRRRSAVESMSTRRRVTGKLPRSRSTIELATAGTTPVKSEEVEQPSPAKRYLSVNQVVEKLGGSISNKLVYKLAATGKLRANKATGKVLIEEDSLTELMEGPRPTSPVPQHLPPPRRPRGRPRSGANGSGKRRIELW